MISEEDPQPSTSRASSAASNINLSHFEPSESDGSFDEASFDLSDIESDGDHQLEISSAL